MATFTVSNVAGVTADYTDIAAAITAAVASADTTDNIIIIGGNYTGTYSLNTTNQGDTLRLYALNRPTFAPTGGNVFTVIRPWSPFQFYGFEFFPASSAKYFINESAGDPQWIQMFDCDVRGCKVRIEQRDANRRQSDFTRSIFRNVATEIGGSAEWSYFNNCTISGGNIAVDCRNAGNTTQISYFSGNYVENCDVYFSRITAASQVYNFAKNNFYNCRFKFTAAAAYVLCNSAAEVRAKFQADLGFAPTSDYMNNNLFSQISINSEMFQIGEDGYVKLRHRGAARFAQTVLAANFVANPDFTLTADYITRNTTDDATAQAILTFPQARKIRRVELHFSGTTSGAEYFGGSVNGSIPLSVEASLDGVNYLAPITVRSGLIEVSAGVYNFDLPAALLAKTLRVSVTLTGATAGLVRINGVSAEANAPEDYLVQGGRALRQQLATGAGNLIPAPYSFRMPAPLRTNMLNPAKEYYTFAEITTEASGNPNVSIVAGPDANHIANVQVDNGSKVINVFTFKAS